MSENTGMNIAVIYGSARSARHGIKAARFVINQLEARGHKVSLVEPLAYPLPLLDKMYKEFEPGQAPQVMQQIADILTAADAFVIVSGEYNHGEPAGLKNLLDHFQKEYLYKPSAIVTYSAGPFGGVRALVTLRAILAELGTASIPSSFPISGVMSAFEEDGTPKDEAYNRRIGKFLDELEWYGNALRAARCAASCEAVGPVQQAMCRGEGSK